MTKNEINEEELFLFLNDELPKEREQEIADAIEHDEDLQALMEEINDVETMMFFDNLRKMQKKQSSPEKNYNTVGQTKNLSAQSKWGAYLESMRKGSSIDGNYGGRSYRSAADEADIKEIEKRKDGEKKSKPIWPWIVWSVIFLGLILYKTCSDQKKEEIEKQRQIETEEMHENIKKMIELSEKNRTIKFTTEDTYGEK